MPIGSLLYYILEIKPCGLVSRIRDVEAFWYKTEIKIIYFVPLCLILLVVSDCIHSFFKYQKLRVVLNHCHQTQSKTKKTASFFLRLEADFFFGFKTFPDMLLNFCKSRIYDKVTGLRAFEGQLPYQKYRRPPIVVRLPEIALFWFIRYIFSVYILT
jgi:hypothetical protein